MPSRNRTFALLVGLITLGALALRLYGLDTQSLWYDEGVTAEIAQRGIAELTSWTAGDIQPPLYYYLVALWGRAAGWSEWSLRFPSVFFGVLQVPLLAATAAALMRRRRAGLLAALFVAVHPLSVYYSQEARMYAMLTTLGVLLGYLMVCALSGRARRWSWWAAYTVSATAAVYTHYFAFFLLLALAIAFFSDRLLHRHPSDPAAAPGENPASSPIFGRWSGPWLGFLAANLAVLIFYVPWFTALTTRFSVDASYWEGELKLWEALRHVAISFTSGETVLEEEATQLLLVYGALTAMALLGLLWKDAASRRAALYALLWLALPVTAVLLLAIAAPKFNARYVMVALPGLLLIWSGGLAAYMTLPEGVPLRGWQRWLGGAQIVAALGLAMVLLAGLVIADYNWFFDPAFTKAEWREVSRYVRARIQERRAQEPSSDEMIILVSGHAWPVWHYYAPDLEPLRLPELEILDVNAVLDFASSAVPLRNALVGKSGAWLVQWQEIVVDPMNIVPLQLGLAGDPEELDVQFWHLQVRHYTNVNASAVLVEPTTLLPTSANFGNQVYLLDYTVADNGDLLLFWQLHEQHMQPAPDLHISGHTFTADGMPFARVTDRRPAGYEYPSFRWRGNQVTLGRIPAAEWAGDGALPETYRMRLGVYDVNGELTGLDVIGPQGQPLGKHVTLDLDLPRPTRGPDVVDKVTFAQLITDLYVEVALSTEQAEPGQAFGVEIHWYAEEKPPGDYELHVGWRLRRTNQLVGEEVLPLTPTWPTSRWPDDELMRTLHQLRPPRNLAPDDYWLELGLDTDESGAVQLPFRVLGSTRLYISPPYATPIDQVFGDGLRLLGVIEPIDVSPRVGEPIALTLVWQAMDFLPADYSATVQWLGEDSRPAAQVDLALPGGSSNWLPDQVELQTVIVEAPAVSGAYRLVTAVYDANQTNLPRLLTAEGMDLVDLGTITVRP
jgi:hypothetical protein